MVLAYPPGIPLICPGELITPDIISYIEYLRGEGSNLQGTPDPSLRTIRVLSFA
jgi:arginine/lysine/ornithine decarboxylase